MKLCGLRTVGVGLVLLVMGCASAADKYQPDPTASEAWNIARAAGMTRIEDMERQTPSSSGGLGRDLSDGGFALSSAFNPPPGFSGGLGIGFGVLSLFTASTPPAPNEFRDGFIAWIPEELLNNGEDPEEVIEAALLRGFDDFLAPGEGLVEDVNIGYHKTTMLGWLDLDIVRTRDCPVEIEDEDRRLFNENCWGWYTINFSDTDDELRTAPYFLGNLSKVDGPYFFSFQSAGILEHGVNSTYLSEEAFITAFSAHLPSWIYIYRTYDRETNEPPYLVHQGRRLDFIKPG